MTGQVNALDAFYEEQRRQKEQERMDQLWSYLVLLGSAVASGDEQRMHAACDEVQRREEVRA